METRTTKCHSVEARSEGGRNTIVGYAATFDTPYPVDNVTEIIDRSAFTRTLQDTPDVFALVGHDPSRVLARTRNGTLSLSTDEKGLRCEILMNDTQESRDVFSLVQNGTLDSMSFGFKVREQKFEYRDGGVHRRVRDVDLHEVSIVAFPANSEAKLTMRDRALAQQCVETRGVMGEKKLPQKQNPASIAASIRLPAPLAAFETRSTFYVKFEGDREAWVETEDGDEIAGLMDGYDDPEEFYESQDIDGPNDAAGFARYLENLDFVKAGDVVVVGNKKHKVR